SGELAATPPGTVSHLSRAATEQAFGGAAAVQTARFDQVSQAGLAKHDNFFAATGDFGSLGISKQHKETGAFPGPTAWWPGHSPVFLAGRGAPPPDPPAPDPSRQNPPNRAPGPPHPPPAGGEPTSTPLHASPVPAHCSPRPGAFRRPGQRQAEKETGGAPGPAGGGAGRLAFGGGGGGAPPRGRRDRDPAQKAPENRRVARPPRRRAGE